MTTHAAIFRNVFADGRRAGETIFSPPARDEDVMQVSLTADEGQAILVPTDVEVGVFRSTGTRVYVRFQDDDAVDNLPDIAGEHSSGWFPLLRGLDLTGKQGQYMVLQSPVAAVVDVMFYNWELPDD